MYLCTPVTHIPKKFNKYTWCFLISIKKLNFHEISMSWNQWIYDVFMIFSLFANSIIFPTMEFMFSRIFQDCANLLFRLFHRTQICTCNANFPKPQSRNTFVFERSFPCTHKRVNTRLQINLLWAATPWWMAKCLRITGFYSMYGHPVCKVCTIIFNLDQECFLLIFQPNNAPLSKIVNAR